MKKLKLTGKLSLNKETISKLNDDQMNGIKGGEGVRSDNTCLGMCLVDATFGCASGFSWEYCCESDYPN